MLTDEKNYESLDVKIDFEMSMANSIAGQILNNEACRRNYARILAIATLKIADTLQAQSLPTSAGWME